MLTCSAKCLSQDIYIEREILIGLVVSKFGINHRQSPLCGFDSTSGNAVDLPQYDPDC